MNQKLAQLLDELAPVPTEALTEAMWISLLSCLTPGQKAEVSAAVNQMKKGYANG